MSGATPACSQANSGPVRPKPVSTSSAMSSSAVWRSISRERAQRRRADHMRMPPAPRSSGSTITAASSAAALRDERSSADDGVASTGSGSRATVEQLVGERIGEQSARADAHRAERVAVVRVLERDDRAAAARRGSASTAARSSPRLRPPSSRRRRRRRDSGRAARASTSAAASRAAGSCVKPAKITCSSVRACSAMAAAISGWAWPWSVTHHDEIASKISRPVDVVEIRALGAHDLDRWFDDAVLRVRVPDVRAVGGATSPRRAGVLRRCAPQNHRSRLHDGDRSFANSRRAASTFTSWSICVWVCAALTVIRNRDVPGATVGGRTAPTRNPCSTSDAPMATVVAGVADDDRDDVPLGVARRRRMPCVASATRRYRQFSRSRARAAPARSCTTRERAARRPRPAPASAPSRK